MDTIIVTKADTPLGLTICKNLLDLGARVYAIGEDFSKTIFNHKYFHPVKCNLQSTGSIQEFSQYIEKTHGSIYGLVHISAELNEKDALESLVQKTLVSAFALSNFFLEGLKKERGHLIYITQKSQHTVTNALNSAIQSFSNTIFAENQTSGLKVLHLELSAPSGQDFSQIHPNSIAEKIQQFFQQPEGSLITKMVMSPQAKDKPLAYALNAGLLSKNEAAPLPQEKKPQETLIPTPKPKLNRNNKKVFPKKY